MSLEFVLAVCLFTVLFVLQRLIHLKEITKIKRNLLEGNNKESKNEKFTTLELSDKEKVLTQEVIRLKSIIKDTKTIAQDGTMIKSDFLTNIRHEIRTPMNSILVFSQMIEKETIDNNLQSYASSIHTSGQDLLSLLNNIIELSEIDSGRFEIQTSAIYVKKFIDTLVEVHKYEAAKKGLDFSVEIDRDMPESIKMDEKKVKQILDNLLSNALKFTSSGEVKVLVSQESFDESQHEASISFKVQDTGLGILQVNQEKIFKIFESKEINHKPEYQGTGLSLSINQKLALLMNGSLEVQSELEEGSTFTLTLDNVEVVLLSKSHDVDESSIDFSSIREDAKILVIDESQKTLDVLIECFHQTKVKVFAYKSPREAISMLRNTKVDLIMINVDVLSMDDSAVAKVIRSISSAPVVSLINDSLKGISFHENGVKPLMHLKKPLQKIELFRVLLKILNSQNMLIQDTKVHTQEIKKELDFLSSEKESNAYFKHQAKEMENLLNKALSTNDLDVISKLAKGMYQLSRIYKVESLSSFAKKLLSKIDTFDIEGIDTMLKEYERKSKEFKYREV